MVLLHIHCEHAAVTTQMRPHPHHQEHDVPGLAPAKARTATPWAQDLLNEQRHVVWGWKRSTRSTPPCTAWSANNSKTTKGKQTISRTWLGRVCMLPLFSCVDCVWCRPFRTTPTRSARLDRARYSYLSHATREASAAASSTSACLLSCSGLLC